MSKPRSINRRAVECRDWLLRDFSDRRGMPKDLLMDSDWADMRRVMGDMIAAELETLKCDVESGHFPKSEASALAHENFELRELLGSVALHFLLNHPLPWSVVHDWTCEVHDAAGNVVCKLKGANEARRLIELAIAISLGDDQ